MNQKTGTLYIVSTPIGHPDDITLRALKVLESADALICEEYKPARKLLGRLKITPKELIALNEHSERGKTGEVDEIILRLHQGQNLALFSDCGTPVFADPGRHLIQQAVQFNVPIKPIPGPSSLMTALSILDVDMRQFVFGGFLPRKPQERLQELVRLKGLGMPLILMDTPYRMGRLLEDVTSVFGKGQRITLACDMTQPAETIYRGSAGDIKQKVHERKAEFILIVHGPPTRSRRRK